MKKFSPYRISHIDLSEQAEFLRPDLENEGSYTVLWWKEIPLGSFYLECGEVVSDAQYRDRIVTSIVPAISFYASKKPDTPLQELDRFAVSNSLWRSKLELLLAPSIGEDLPEVVPISVIVCTRNRPAYVSKCLRQLTTSTPRPQEIIVVDNAPVDDSTRKIVLEFPEVTYVQEPRPGLDIARNRGIMESNSQIIAFVDDDVEVHTRWAYRVWETFLNESIDAMTGLVFASVLNTDAEIIFEKYWSFNRGYIDKIYGDVYFSASLPNGAPVSEIGAGANMAFRKSVFDEVGYFHELLDAGAAGCSGDSEMWFRILADLRNIAYNPRAVAFHSHRKDLNELRKQLFSYMRGCTTALFWQHRQRPDAGYGRNRFLMLISYAIMAVKGFPRYSDRSQTLWVEINGVFAGIAYFYKKENRHLFSVKKVHNS